MRHRTGYAAGLALTLGLVAGCGSSHPAANSADGTFLQDMLPHHRQAIAAAQLAATKASDPRVRAFGRRIVAEQTPEVDRMQAAATAAQLSLDQTAGAAMAVNRISPATLQSLAGLSGPSFDRTFLRDSITSEMGAVAMAKAELASGRDPAVRKIAGPIAGAENPGSEIPQLQALLAQIA